MRIMVVFLSACIGYSACAAEEGSRGRTINGIPIRERDIEDLLKKVPDDQRRELVERLAREGYVVRSNDLWALLRSPDTVLAAVAQADEPFSKDVIDALKRAFDSAEHLSRDNTHLAALLYRYGVDDGRKYLFERLLPGHTSVSAAHIAGLNFEEDVLEDVLVTFEVEPFHRELCLALSYWDDEAVVASLSKMLTERRSNLVLMLSLARLGQDDVAEAAQQMFDAAPTVGPHSIERAWAAAILARLRPQSRDAMITALDELWNGPSQFADWHDDLSLLMGFIAAPESDAKLMQWIRTELQRLSTAKSVGQESTWVVTSVRELARRHPKEATDLATQALDCFSQRKMDTRGIGVVLIRLATPRSDEVLRKHFDDAWLNRAKQILELRQLPCGFLPRSSRIFCPNDF